MPDVSTFDVVTMLGAYESIPRPSTFLREMIFGGRERTFSTEYVLIDIRKGTRKMAPFVNPVIGGKIMEHGGYRTDKYTPPLVAPQDVITPERLQQRSAGENIVSGRTPADRLGEEQARILNHFDDAITRREEWMIAQLLFTGQIHMVGDGVDEYYNVGFDNTDTLSSQDLWSASTATIYEDLKGWALQVMRESGLYPNICVMAENVSEAFLNNSTIQTLLDIRNVELGKIDPSRLPNGASYIGRLSGLGIDFYTYNEWYADDSSGTITAMVPDDTLALFSSADRNLGAIMLYGAFTEIKDRTTYEGSRIPRIWTDQGKNAEFVQVVSRPLPVIIDADSWFVANVL